MEEGTQATIDTGNDGFDLTAEELAEVLGGDPQSETAVETETEQTDTTTDTGAGTETPPAETQVPAAETQEEPPAVMAIRRELDAARAALETEKAGRAKEQADPFKARLEKVAKGFGVDQNQLLDKLEIQQIAQGFVDQGDDDQTANQRAWIVLQQQRLDEEKQQAETARHNEEQAAKARNDAIRAEIDELTAIDPDAAKDVKATVEASQTYLKPGTRLATAWLAAQRDGLLKENAELKAQLEANKAAQKAASASTGSRSYGGGESQYDPDFSGWDN